MVSSASAYPDGPKAGLASARPITLCESMVKYVRVGDVRVGVGVYAERSQLSRGRALGRIDGCWRDGEWGMEMEMGSRTESQLVLFSKKCPAARLQPSGSVRVGLATRLATIVVAKTQLSTCHSFPVGEPLGASEGTRPTAPPPWVNCTPTLGQLNPHPG